MSKKSLIVILGPTAVGKTELSIKLAKKLNTEIISGDSMLVYKGFDIGTAKPDMKERDGVPHSLIDILEPDEGFNVTDFQKLAAEEINRISDKGCIPILAGGTGLYIKSLLEGYQFNSNGEDKEYRQYLEKLAEEQGKAYIHVMLEKVDPKTAERLHVNDIRRVIRALEVQHLGHESLSESRTADDTEIDGESLIYNAYVVGLRRDRAALYDRINRRVDIMMEQGLEKEVRSLLGSGVPADAQSMKGIGYKELVRYIEGESSLQQAVSDIKKFSRHFAKRQITWYKKMPYIHWYDVDNIDGDTLLEKVYKDIAGYFNKKTN